MFQSGEKSLQKQSNATSTKPTLNQCYIGIHTTIVVCVDDGKRDLEM